MTPRLLELQVELRAAGAALPEEPVVARFREPLPTDSPFIRAVLTLAKEESTMTDFHLGYLDGRRELQNWKLSPLYERGYRAGRTQSK